MAIAQPAIFDEIDEVAEAEAEADARAEADVRAGRVISHEAMKTRLLSWGRADELSPPEVGS